MDSKLYRFLRPIIKFLTNTFIRPKYIGIENIPKEGRIILAGRHTSILDCFLSCAGIGSCSTLIFGSFGRLTLSE